MSQAMSSLATSSFQQKIEEYLEAQESVAKPLQRSLQLSTR